MSYWSHLVNVFRTERINREIDEELHAHIDDAIAAGRDPEEARKAFGPMLHAREESRDLKLAVWLDVLRSDAVFGWRQLRRNKVTSIAAVLSLALAAGACIATFRLADAVLFRPLPVADPHRLFALEVELVDARTGNIEHSDSFEYPLFRELRTAAKGDAELIAIGYANEIDLTYGADQDMEKAVRQYCSGWMFSSFGLKPALGRLLTAADDRTPGAHPYAVLSYQYWRRRFGANPKIIGKTFRADARLYEIVGVAPNGFTGTEPGIVADIWVPTMMNAGAIEETGWAWFRTWVQLRPGVEPDRVREKLRASFAAYRRERVKTWGTEVPKDRIEEYLKQPLILRLAATGVSELQRNLRRPLAMIGAVGLLVLLIACANLANLMTAQAKSRAREMALRVSIGAGRLRLAQLVLVESAIIALTSSALGGVFAWWSAPLVADRMATKLVLPWDWRVLGFAALITLGVTCLFGLAPALWASGVKPMSALRGGEEPHGKRRLMNALLAAQVAFCFVIHFLAGMFVTTFERLSNQPTGFAVDNVLTLETVTVKAQPPVYWEQEMEHLRTVRSVQAAGLCGWALMTGNAWTSDI